LIRDSNTIEPMRPEMSEPADSCFTLTIHTRTGFFGETSDAERQGVAKLLLAAAQQIGSSAPYAPLKDTGGHVIGGYKFGPAMINGPGAGFDDTHWNVRPVILGGRIAR
jgi:hypothetical protein